MSMIQALKPVTTHTIAPAGASVNQQIGGTTTVIRVTSTAEVQLAFGSSSVTASATDMDHPAKPHVEYYMVQPGQYVAAFGSATVKISEMSK